MASVSDVDWQGLLVGLPCKRIHLKRVEGAFFLLNLRRTKIGSSPLGLLWWSHFLRCV
jgi:hypothetical protein